MRSDFEACGSLPTRPRKVAMKLRLWSYSVQFDSAFNFIHNS